MISKLLPTEVVLRCDRGQSQNTTSRSSIDLITTTMFPQRTILRTTAALRSPATRSTFQRRLASTENSAFQGAEDNAFNRERKAVKDHAAATSGEIITSMGSLTALTPQISDLWRKLSI